MKSLWLLMAAALAVAVTAAKPGDDDHHDTHDEALVKLIDRANQITHDIVALEHKIADRIDPERLERAGSLEARVEHLEDDTCDDHFYQCGGDDPQCISDLFVCDHHKDCRNGEDEKHCDLPMKAGDVFIGDVVYDDCTQRQPEHITIIVKSVDQPEYFTAYPELHVVLKIPFENDHEEGEAALPTNAHYNFAKHEVRIHSPEDDGLAFIGHFDGHDFDRFVGDIVHELSDNACAQFIFHREVENGDDDDNKDDKHH